MALGRKSPPFAEEREGWAPSSTLMNGGTGKPKTQVINRTWGTLQRRGIEALERKSPPFAEEREGWGILKYFVLRRDEENPRPR